MPGPIPKRSTERRRRNKASQAEVVQVQGEVKALQAPAGLHPMALEVFTAFTESGMAQFFEPSDWSLLRVTVCNLSRYLESGKPISGPNFGTIMQVFESLGGTEGSRRRMRLELERVKGKVEEQPAGVTNLQAFKQRAKSNA